MFSKLKSSGPGGQFSLLDSNPITQYFEVGRQTASAGPELAWKIFEATRRSDKKVNS